jgi:hypothetical protein
MAAAAKKEEEEDKTALKAAATKETDLLACLICPDKQARQFPVLCYPSTGAKGH